MKKRLSVLFVLATYLPALSASLRVAVEFNTHASSFYVAKSLGLFEKHGVKIDSFDSYVTGMALSTAITRGDVDAAYICLIPAILAYANGGVPIKVVCGTHRYGYAMVVNPSKIRSLRDLSLPGLRIACPREGSPNDCLMHRLAESTGLGRRLLSHIVRMPPPMAFMALKAGRVDAAFLPEGFPSMAKKIGFKVIVDSKKLWPGMQGSVLVVRAELIDKSPDTVKGMVDATKEAIEWLIQNPQKASIIVSKALSLEGFNLRISPDAVRLSITEGMECSPYIDPKAVQEEINYLYHLGYIKKPFKAGKILYLKWIK